MDEILMNVEEKMQTSLDNTVKRFTNVRAGRANPSMLDSIKVDFYGTKNPINAVATVSVPDGATIFVKPFDKASLGEIEKAIIAANIGLNPTNNGESLIIKLPQLTEETRRDYVKQVKAMAEEGKVAVRNARQDGNNAVKKNEDLTEDDKKYGTEEVQSLTNKFNKSIEDALAAKEKELMTV